MKKKSISLVARKTTPTIAITTPTTTSGHHATVVDANADTLTGSLGISNDRAKELEQDIIAGCKAVIGAESGQGESLTLLQVIAIATKNCQNDNELVFATALIAESYARNDFQGLENQIENGPSSETTTEDNLDSDNETGAPADFAAFLQSMLASQGEGAFATADDTENTEDGGNI